MAKEKRRRLNGIIMEPIQLLHKNEKNIKNTGSISCLLVGVSVS
jgi:hypothetical protein